MHTKHLFNALIILQITLQKKTKHSSMIAHTYTNAMWQLTQLSAPAAWIKIDALQRNHRAQLSCEGKAALTLLCN